MADNHHLDAFLADNAPQEAAQAPAAPTAPESQPKPEAAPTPQPGAKALPESKPAEKREEPDDTDPPSPLDGEPIVPRRAFEDERRKRQDWKEKAARYEGELAAIKRQLEEAQRPPQPPPQQQPVQRQIPDPRVDPEGYHAAIMTLQEEKALNERLNNSEDRIRDKLGDEKVDEYIAEFKQMTQRDPTLFGKLYSQRHPYGWLAREVDRQRMLRDVGDDPAAFRAKIEAEARAKWEAEAQQLQQEQRPPPSPAARLQPSLATARSVAGRSEGTWTGEPSLEDVLAPVQNRKSQNGTRRHF